MNPIPGISTRDLSSLATLLEPIQEGYRLSLFGSRARGCYGPFSDIDIVAEGEGPIPLLILARIESDLSESDLPVKVDLIDAHRASADFLEAISADLVSI
jgi:predicted nucleotidyltransferase